MKERISRLHLADGVSERGKRLRQRSAVAGRRYLIRCRRGPRCNEPRPENSSKHRQPESLANNASFDDFSAKPAAYSRRVKYGFVGIYFIGGGRL